MNHRRKPARLRTPGLAIAVSLAPGLVLFVSFFLVPTVVVVATSFSDWSSTGASFIGLENFSAVFDDRQFWYAARNTGFFVSAAVLVQIPLATLVALVLARRIRGWKVVRTLLFLPNMMSGAALGLLYVFAFNPRFGLVNGILRTFGLDDLTRDWLFDVDTAIWAVTSTWVFSIGLYVILILTEIHALPHEVHEAAQLDGATTLQREWHITVPLIRPVLGTCFLLAVLFTLSYFDGVFVMTGGGPADRTTTLVLYGYQAYSRGEWGRANAVGSVILVAGTLLILLVRRMGRLEVSER